MAQSFIQVYEAEDKLRVCECGRGCKKSLAGMHGRRIYHPDCQGPSHKTVRHRQVVVRRMKLAETRPKVEMCTTCFNQPHRRRKRGKCTCGEVYTPELIECPYGLLPPRVLR